VITTVEDCEKNATKWKSYVKRNEGYIIELDEREMFGDFREGVCVNSETPNRP
jgi:hypothetical protein